MASWHFFPPWSQVFPLVFLSLLFLPTCITVLIWSIKHSRQEMKKAEMAVLFLLPTFTNLYFIKTVKKDFTDHDPGVLEQDLTLKKSQSVPNLQRKFSAPVLKTRSNSLGHCSTPVKDSFEIQSEFSLFHSNILFFLFFLGAFIILCGDLTIQYKKGYGQWSTTTKTFVGIFFVNLLLWLDFNYSMFKKKQPGHQSDNRWEYFIVFGGIVIDNTDCHVNNNPHLNLYPAEQNNHLLPDKYKKIYIILIRNIWDYEYKFQCLWKYLNNCYKK